MVTKEEEEMTRGIKNEEYIESRQWCRGRGPYYCDECSFVTPYKDWLIQHKDKVHAY